jgi:hypothetical protein
MLRMSVRSGPIFTSNQEILTQILTFTEPKGDVVIEMSGKYDFQVTCEVIEMMEAESKVIVNWSYNFQILKGSLCESTT